MSTERRNLYRLLYVQPEAPTEVIKAAHRALMVKQRMHPDLGGDNDIAARLNAALAVLTDPVQRRAYDLSLRHKTKQGASTTPPASTQATSAAPIKPLQPVWLDQRRCPFCQTAFVLLPKIGSRCAHCDSPLTPLPRSPKPAALAHGETLGRRRGEQRFERDMPLALQLPGDVRQHSGRLRDLSFTGLSFMATVAPIKGSTLRVGTPMFDALAEVVTVRRQGTQCTVHARLLTLELQRNSSGVYVNTQA
jgi:curved DNA-binding protein CbpA